MILRKGEVTVIKSHTCDHCGRTICKHERAWCRVELIRDGRYRAVESRYSCCKPLR